MFLKKLLSRKNGSKKKINCKCVYCLEKSINQDIENYSFSHSDRCRCDKCNKSFELERYLEKKICSNCVKKLAKQNLVEHNVLLDRIHINNDSSVFSKLCDICSNCFVRCKCNAQKWIETDRYPEVSYGSRCDSFWVTEGEWHDCECNKLLIKEKNKICNTCKQGYHI